MARGKMREYPPLYLLSMALSRSKRVFFLLTLSLAVFDSVFVIVNHRALERELRREIEVRGDELRASLATVMEQTYTNLLTIATFVANDPATAQLFLAGARAVEAEGGGAGGPRAARLREELYASLRSNWGEVQRTFATRQLHFHLGPGSTSFLRVHKRERFGDAMDEVRYTIVDTNREKTPRYGFETGRVYSGLRGVVPVFATDPGTAERVHVGALEAGTSFDYVLRILHNNYAADVAVTLNEAHLRRNMWPEAVDQQFEEIFDGCQCAVEASTTPMATEILSVLGRSDRGEGATESLVYFDGTPYLWITVPLRDYRGELDASLPDAGRVSFWRDATLLVSSTRAAERFNLIFGITAFLLIEIILFFAIRTVTQRLEKGVRDRTVEIDRQKAELERLAVEDSLTGALNRRGFERQASENLARDVRMKKPTSLLMIDIDYFKRINDTHGHEAGDRVLVATVQAIKGSLREYDVLGRIGGEEFAVLMPDTEHAAADKAAARVLAAVRTTSLTGANNSPLKCTVSVGIHCSDGTRSSLEDLLLSADRALYEAKESGRDRAVRSTAQGPDSI